MRSGKGVGIRVVLVLNNAPTAKFPDPGTSKIRNDLQRIPFTLMAPTPKSSQSAFPDSSDGIVYIVDDEPAIRDALKTLLETEGFRIQCFASAREFLEASSPGMHGCVVLDLCLPDISGLDLQKELARRNVYLPIIFLSGYGTVRVTAEAFKSGAFDFIEKPFDNERLLERIREAFLREETTRQGDSQRQAIRERYGRLSEREKQVFQYMVKGYASKEIAKSLVISHRTVEIYRSHVMQKMGAATLAELVGLALHLEASDAFLTPQSSPPMSH
jgi:two-component system response regulator FixJ